MMTSETVFANCGIPIYIYFPVQSLEEEKIDDLLVEGSLSLSLKRV